MISIVSSKDGIIVTLVYSWSIFYSQANLLVLILKQSNNSQVWAWLETRPTYLARKIMRRSRLDIFGVLTCNFM